jgi:hypothetical protein
MGIDANGSRFLLYAQRAGVDFTRTLMIGRQGLHLTANRLAANFAEFGRRMDDIEAKQLLEAANGYAEPFFQQLGAAEVDSLDASDYEGAMHVHDLNTPVADELKGRFSTVLDGGSLEHVFNFPVAVQSCMEMVAVGGHYLGITPTSNFSGHGFYQFSPELFYRILTAENGFTVERMLLYEDRPASSWYEVPDPLILHRRVTFTNPNRSYLAFIARKLAAVPLFTRWPQQSDYAAAWASESRTRRVRPSIVARILRTPAQGIAALGRLALGRPGGDAYPSTSFRPFDPHKQ